MVDLDAEEYLYAAKDCPQGRVFLKKLRDVAGQKEMKGDGLSEQLAEPSEQVEVGA
jgi:hypothetical protein